MTGPTTIRLIASGAAIAAALSLAACGTSSTGEATSDNPVEITWWGWTDTPRKQAKKFMKTHPNIKVKVVNAGTGNDQYTAINNAIAAGSGVPDLATIEYYALPQFAYSDKLIDLTKFGADKYAKDYTPGTWSSVNVNGGIYGLPTDSGPMALFYNKEAFEKAGVTEVPTTWDEYYEAAKKIRATGAYITSDTGDAGFYDSMVWQASGKPYNVSKDGKTVTLNLTGDKGAKTFAAFWQKMIDEDLIDTKTQGWSDDWYRGLGDGSIASLFSGAWMTGNLAIGAPAAAGKWRVAQMPTPEAGSTANAENGGSSVAIFDNGDDAKAKAAWEFLDWMNHSEEGTEYGVSLGIFPARTSVLESEEFLNVKNEYCGGQEINKELTKAANNVLPGWKFLPFEVYARNIFTDTVGKAFTSNSTTTISAGVKTWQENLTSYAKEQGFAVK